MNIVFTPTAWEQYIDWQRTGIGCPRLLINIHLDPVLIWLDQLFNDFIGKIPGIIDDLFIIIFGHTMAVLEHTVTNVPVDFR